MTVPPSPHENKPGNGHPHEPVQKNSEGLNDYFKSHMRETIAYILMVLGIILLFFEPIWGGVLIGVIAGSYFGDEIVNYLKGWQLGSDYKTITRNFIIGGVALAFLITAPAIFLGAAVAVGIKQLFIGQSDEPGSK